jgi:nucleoside-diphosphate kinase
MQMQQTLVIIKPDAVQRTLVGRILARFEDKGLTIAALKMLRISPEKAARLYSVHEGKSFHKPLLQFITAGPAIAVVLRGLDAIAVARSLMGDTDSSQARPGTIRGDFALSARLNLVHGSDSEASAQREIPLFFQPEEILDAPAHQARWIYGIQHAQPDPGDKT